MAVIPRTVILLPEGKGSVLNRCVYLQFHTFVSVSFTTVIRGCLHTSVYCDCWYFTLPLPFPKRGRTSHLLFLTSSTSLKDKSEKHENQCFSSTSSTFLIPNLLFVPIPSADIFQLCLYTEVSSAEHQNCCNQTATWPNYRKYEWWQLLLWTAGWRAGPCGSSNQFCFGCKSMPATLIRKSLRTKFSRTQIIL